MRTFRHHTKAGGGREKGEEEVRDSFESVGGDIKGVQGRKGRWNEPEGTLVEVA